MPDIISEERLAEISRELQAWLDERNLVLRAVASLQVSAKEPKEEPKAETAKEPEAKAEEAK